MEERQEFMDDDEVRSVVDDENEQKSVLKELILVFETCPSLWNPKDKNYLNTLKRNEDLDKLVQVYKNIKPNATRDDVKKKINSLRSNYRKELKKIENSKRSGSGADEVYKPTSLTFHLLQFLAKIEKPKLTKDSEVRSEEDNSLVISSISNESPPVKIRKTSGTLAKQNELLDKACSLLSQPSVSSQPPEVDPLALVWSDKLKTLNPTQRLYAEKAINDILFEAQLNNLHPVHTNSTRPTFTQQHPTNSTRPIILQHPTNSTRPIILQHPTRPTFTLQNPTNSTIPIFKPLVQKGPASDIILNNNSDEYTVGSLFSTFKPT